MYIHFLTSLHGVAFQQSVDSLSSRLYGLYNSFISRGSMSCYISSSSSCYLPSCSISPLVVLPTLQNMVCISTRSCLPHPKSRSSLAQLHSARSLLPVFKSVVPSLLSVFALSFFVSCFLPSFLVQRPTSCLVSIRYNGFWYELPCVVLILINDTSLESCVVLSLSGRAKYAM